MSITLARPTVIDRPTLVSPVLVQRLDTFDVPTTIREHAWTLLQHQHGPTLSLDGPWWTMGEFIRDGVRLTVVARLQRDGMQYGFNKGA